MGSGGVRRGRGGKAGQGHPCPETPAGWGWGRLPLETSVTSLPAATRCPQPKMQRPLESGWPQSAADAAEGPPPPLHPQSRAQNPEMFCFQQLQTSPKPRKQDTSKSGGRWKLLEGLSLSEAAWIGARGSGSVTALLFIFASQSVCRVSARPRGKPSGLAAACVGS